MGIIDPKSDDSVIIQMGFQRYASFSSQDFDNQAQHSKVKQDLFPSVVTGCGILDRDPDPI
jgi:hypothetical protein